VELFIEPKPLAQRLCAQQPEQHTAAFLQEWQGEPNLGSMEKASTASYLVSSTLPNALTMSPILSRVGWGWLPWRSRR
jgi:hypothetical protein